MKIVDVEPIIAMVQAAIAMIDIVKADSSGRSELEEMLKTLESAPEVTDINAGKTQPSEEGYSKDIISRQAVMRAIDEALIGKGCSADGTMTARLINDYVIKKVPPTEPKRETATVSVGRSKEGATMWYECDACGEPVDQEDAFCRRCGRELIHERTDKPTSGN